MTQQSDVIEYYNRETGELCRETVMGDAFIKWAYRSLSGKLVSPFLFSSSLLSRLLGCYFNSSLSTSKIAKTIADLEINEFEFAQPRESFKSFNDFFYRKLKEDARPFSPDPNRFLSPADGRLLVYDALGEATRIRVKGVESSLQDLFGRDIHDFDGGKVAVVRLCPADYHRYHFPCDGTVVEQVDVKGKYHSVNPVALAAQERVFCLNKRSFTLIDTEAFGRVAYMEVGAFGVAGIHQTYTGTIVKRMQEKGYFDFGGSTVVLVFQKDKIQFDADLLGNSAQGIETFIKVGDSIAATIQ